MKKRQHNFYNYIRYFSAILFVLCLLYIGNALLLQPYLSARVVNDARALYANGKEKAIAAQGLAAESVMTPELSPDSDTSADSSDIALSEELHDKEGRLLEFTQLLALNEDVKGWLTVGGTNIDYPVLQSGKEDPEYYLYRNIYKENDKAGSLFLHAGSLLGDNEKNLVIYGHNMKSTNTMFHQLLKYDKLSFYKEHPYINFDSIYQKGQWKIIAVIKADADTDNTFFNFIRTSFTGDTDFLQYIYELRNRSIYNIPVDADEKDELLTLVTCSYEMDNYRTVVVARKLRAEETLSVDTEKAVENPHPLYPNSWYAYYGGTKPVIPAFNEAYEAGTIEWYSHR
ncbi:class B sortase [Anaerocolumna sp. AGMB13020]|uniref:class B sortase n=1 Tax=Anaerocolumna sp. AGMB13020 TaxID=3081750 RepID=UPI00295386B2|nr:class B sortase [Anaerocolumna sp. AGMB13020]WOO37146.1 class B sortase [Anaerocolumna sp. AGMB13020]